MNARVLTPVPSDRGIHDKMKRPEGPLPGGKLPGAVTRLRLDAEQRESFLRHFLRFGVLAVLVKLVSLLRLHPGFRSLRIEPIAGRRVDLRDEFRAGAGQCRACRSEPQSAHESGCEEIAHVAPP